MENEAVVAAQSTFFTPKKIDKITPFYLSDDFIKTYEHKKVGWSPIGEFTYLRTYARWIENNGKRRKEKWFECVRRVVEGCFDIQKKHCHINKVPWNNVKAQNSAKIMYDLIFRMKFLPPGRGLWLMGTEYVNKNGSTGLNNCSAVSVKNLLYDPITPFKFIMDLSMLGVGLGFDTTCKDKIIIKKPIYTDEIAIIPDSREGWVESLGILLSGFFLGTKIPKFDFSAIRPKDSIIKGFGGTACLTGDTIVYKDRKKTQEYNEITLKKLYEIKMSGKSDGGPGHFSDISLRSLNEDTGEFSRNKIFDIISNGVRPVYNIITKEGYKIKATKNHRFLKENGEYDYVANFSEGDYIAVNGSREIKTGVCKDCGTPISRRAVRCRVCFDKKQLKEDCLETTARQRKDCQDSKKEYCEECGCNGNIYRLIVHHKDRNPHNNNYNNLITLCERCHHIIHCKNYSFGNSYSHKYISFDKIISIKYICDEEVFDVCMNGPNYNFVANGFISHNSGPGPLIEMLKDIEKLLTQKIGKILCSTDIVDINCMVGKCVVSGNVRRTALAALGDADDIEFIKMKDYSLHPKECDNHRWASNNSVKAIVGQDYNMIAELIAKNGEPGLVWLDNARKYGRMKDPENNLDYKVDVANPCMEIFLENMELCNLVESFPSRHESYEEYQTTLKYAYLYAKTVTLVPTHWEQTNAVMLRNRRIGTSQSGIIDAFAKHGRKNILDWCDKGYSYLKKLDSIYSDWLCIPKSIKISTVKPSGSVSILAGVSPGIHYPHSEYYIRRVTITADSPLAKIMKDAGYNVIKSTTDKTAMLVEFPIHTKYFVKGKKEATMWEQLLNVADYQKFWSDNAVSVTVTFKKEETRDIANALSIFDSKLKGVSMLPLKDHGYKHPPYEEITADQYEEMASKLKQPDYSSLTSGEAVGEKYCDSDKCMI